MKDNKGKFTKGHKGFKANLGKKFSVETRKKMSDRMKKKPLKYWLGKKRKPFTEKQIENKKLGMKKAVDLYKEKNGKFWKTGSKCSEETKRKMSLSAGGTGIPQRGKKRYYHLMDSKYKQWRSDVFQRDNWTCQTCGEKGIKLEPHHIKGWAKYEELRYELDNGVTLCYECHQLTKGGKN